MPVISLSNLVVEQDIWMLLQVGVRESDGNCSIAGQLHSRVLNKQVTLREGLPGT